MLQTTTLQNTEQGIVSITVISAFDLQSYVAYLAYNVNSDSVLTTPLRLAFTVSTADCSARTI